MKLLRAIWKCSDFVSRGWNKAVTAPMKKSLLKECGKEVIIARRVKADGWEHISVGNHVSIGEDCRFMTTRADVIIGDHVMFAPDVKVITGGHRIDILDKNMDEVREDEKHPEDDQDIIFEGDNWIGANAMILKGVRIGRGAVVAANALVTKDVPAYSVYGGVSSHVIKWRKGDGNSANSITEK